MSHSTRFVVFVFLLLFAQILANAAPTVTARTPAAAATVSELTTISIIFNEAVTGVDADDLEINAEGALLVTGSGAGPYIFRFTQPMPGTVTVGWTGDHGIAGQAGTGPFAPTGSWTYTLIDTIAPTFASVGGVTGLALRVAGTGYTSAPAVVISGGGGSGATATATVSGGVVTGLTLTNAGAGYISAPAVSLTSGVGSGATAVAAVRGAALTPFPNATVAALTQAEVVFSEIVTGVDAADLLVNGTPATAVTGGGAGPYVFTFAQPAAGLVTFSWAGLHGIADTAAVPNAFVAADWAVTLSAAGHGTLVLNEFLASNGVGISDETLQQQDWIEIFNPGATAVNLAGWALTDDHGEPGKWIFPEWTLDPGQYMIVWASGFDRRPAQKTAGVDNANTSVSPRLHTNFTINENGGYLALIAPETPRVAVTQYPPNYNELATPPVTEFSPQRTDYSYGPQVIDGALRYFTPPKPKATNGNSPLTAITPEVVASVSRGFFNDAFQLVLSCPDPTATIRYTTNFTEPTASNGTVYSGPITISGTTCLRAVAVATGKVPSLPVTNSYVFLDQVLSQSNSPAGFPTNWGTTFGANVFSPASTTPGLVPADYAMDSDPLRVDPNNAASAIDAAKLQRLKDGLRELPLVVVTMNNADMFDASGMYAYPNVTNKTFGYKKCSAEMILPDGSTAFSVICGLSGHGNASRDPLKNPKHGFQLKFKGDFGEGSLNYKLFEDSPATEYDDVILRPDFNSSWRHWSDDGSNASGLFQRTRGTRIHDAWSKDTFRSMGGLASHHRFFHLFINGLYWGIYDFAEQPVDGFAANQLGGTKSDYDIIHEGVVRGGTINVYNTMIGQPATTTNALYDTMKGYLDVPEFIDYMLLHFFEGHQDWGNIKNWYAVRRRASATNPTEGKYQYVPWDQECTLLETTVNRVSNTDVPSGLHTKLVSHAQYRLDFADRVHRHMISPTGALTPAANISRWQKWQTVLDKPIVAESCRWGDYRRDVHNYQTGTYVLYTRENQWLAECARKTGTYFADAGRPATVLTQLRTAGLYPATAAPEYRQNTTSGTIVGVSEVSAGFVLAMNRPGGVGVVYFTTDGNDPHIVYTPTTGAAANSIAPTAVAYSAPITINATTTIKSRILNAGVWSALNEATFTVGIALPSVQITEIMYNPPGGSAYEFIELQNTGTTPVDLGGWYLEGVEQYFPFGTTLNAGDRLVVGSNDGRNGLFAARYPGVAVFGWFGGSLDNAGERVALHDATGRTIFSVEYDDANGWPTAADGGGFSLEIIDTNGDPDSYANWKASDVLKGTPGQANPAPPASAIVLNEVLAVNSGGVLIGGQPLGYIELKNTGGGSVDLNGWKIEGSAGSYTFGAGTSLNAGALLALPCGGVGGLPLALNGAGGIVRLRNAAGAFVDSVSFGNQLADRAIGRVSSVWTLTQPTVAAENSAAPLAVPAGNLVLNEWLASAGPGGADWIEVYNKSATLPVALSSLFFKTDAQLYRYPSLSFVAPLAWLQLSCDEQAGFNQLDFTLPAAGTQLAILDATATAIDTISAVNFGVSVQGVSRGRTTDGAATFSTFTGSASPGAANYVNSWTGPVIHEVLARNQTGDMAPWGVRADWIELRNPNAAPFTLAGMKIGTATSAATAWTIPAGTSIPASGSLALWCDPARSASTTNEANMNTALNLDDQSGALTLFTANGQVANRVEWGPQLPDRSFGLDAGTHKLLANPTRGLANSAAATLGAVAGLKINEWLAAPVSGGDWFEIYNPAAEPVNMAGLYLTDDPSENGRAKFSIPALSFIAAGGWVKWEADGAPEAGRNHVSFNLDANAEYLRLSDSDVNFTTIDAISYGRQLTGVAQGRIADGGAVQLLLAPTPAASNTVLLAPTISAHPANTAAAQGTTASFSVGVNSAAPVTYQWRFNLATIPTATNSTLLLSNIAPANEGGYSVVVTNAAGSTTSAAGSLLVQSTFAQWSAALGVSGADGDGDGDGIGNLAEFLHNLDPLTAASGADRAALPQFALEPPTGTPQFLTLTYRINARALLTGIAHQLSIPLASGWNTVAPDVMENLPPDPVTGDPRVRVKFSIDSGETKKFLRLQIAQ